MKKQIFFIFVCAFAIVFSGCTSLENVESVSSHDISVSEFRNILVVGNFESLKLRKSIEGNTVKEFSREGKTAFSSISLFTPLKEYTEEQILSVFSENQIDCIVQFSVIENQKNESSTVLVPVGYMYVGVSGSSVRQIFDIQILTSDSKEIAARATGEGYLDSDVDKGLAKTAVSVYFEKQNKEIFQIMRDKILEIDNTINVSERKNEMIFSKTTELFRMKIQKRNLILSFTKKASELGDDEHFLSDSKMNNTSETISRGIIKNLDEVEYALSIVRRAIELSE